MASPISIAMKQIADEKNIPFESILEAVEAALAAAYRKDFGNKNQNIKVEFDPEKYDGMTGGIRVFDVKTVIEDMELPEDYFERFEAAHAIKRVEGKMHFHKEPVETAVPDADDEFKFKPKLMIMLSDARDLKPDAQVGEEIRVELNVPAAFGRMAAQTAKQIVLQKLREAERNVIYSDFKGREGELMNVTVQRREGRVVLIDFGRTSGVLLPEDQIDMERYDRGKRMKVVLREVVMSPRGPEIRLSRTSPALVAGLFAQEIPEISSGVVEIKNLVREAGSRTKVAVASTDDAIDPIGSCIGQRGTRIQVVNRELGGEKVDVILWSEDPAAFIKEALKPAQVLDVQLDQEEHIAKAMVGAEQLSLAIGKGGQNVRLAAKLTGWKITIVKQGGEVVADSDKGELVTEILPPASEPAPEETLVAPEGETVKEADAKDKEQE